MAFYRSGGPGSYYRPTFFGGFRFFPPVIKTLLISNVAIWLLMDFLFRPFSISGKPLWVVLTEVFALWPNWDYFWPWQLVTYMFMHGGFGHLFFNMFALWMFGMELENTWGSKKFLLFYLVCGIGAGLTHFVVAPLLGQGAPTVGASGAVYGVMIAFAMLYPDRPIYLYFLLPVRAKYFIAVYIALELFYGVSGTQDGIAHFAHLGGAAVGFVYTLSLMDVLPLRAWWSGVFGNLRNPFARGDRFVKREDGRIRDAKFYDITTGRPKEEQEEVTQEVIDAILDKISRGGYQSLTDKEKRILNDASRKIH